jgi:predicted O-methyltransferase YrrM
VPATHSGETALPIKSHVKRLAKSALWQLHRLGLRAGLVILPNHYYTPIADVNELARTRKDWAKRSPMLGIDAPLADQARRLEEMVAAYQGEYAGNRFLKEAVAKDCGPGFGYVEAQCLHGMLRRLHPRRIIEIGSGVSTYCALRATEMNEVPSDIICVEPYPRDFLRREKRITLIEKKVQEVDPGLFATLERGDLLFIDSSHAMKPGGDVEHIYLRILPTLPAGVIVHIHDITFPFLYGPEILSSLFQWSETSLLQALLTNNDRLKILFSLSWLFFDDPACLSRVFPEFRPATLSPDGLGQTGQGHFPSSTYLITS